MQPVITQTRTSSFTSASCISSNQTMPFMLASADMPALTVTLQVPAGIEKMALAIT